MLRFVSLGSGSSGNCYLLVASTEGLIIDVGIGLRTLKKYFREYGLSLGSVKNILITHDHADHIKSVGTMSSEFNLPVYATREVHAGIERNYCVQKKVCKDNIRYIEKGKSFKLGPFEITPFGVPHDSADNVGYRIVYDETVFCLITDAGSVTEEMEAQIKEANYLVLEANYDSDMLENGSYPPYLKRRIASGTGHLSNAVCAHVLSENMTNKLCKVWLCHLSEENNHPELARKTVEASLSQKTDIFGCMPELVVLKRKTPTGIFELKTKGGFAMTDKACQIMSTLGINELNKMQDEAYKGIAYGHGDVIVVSPTGSGKTLAYLLPLVGLLDERSEALQVVVIVPNRELAMQSVSVLNSMKLPLRAMCCYGGRSTMDEHRKIKQIRPQVVFGTPGRLIDHFDKGNLSSYTVRYAVIDEFDKLLEMGFLKEMATLFSKLPGVRRRFLLSATNAEQIPDFVNINNATRVNYSYENIASRLNVFSLRSEEKDKLVALCDLLCVLGTQSSMVFLNYRDSVERVTEYLKCRGFVVSMFHGGLDQKSREAALYRFSNGSSNIFVSTDLASRGLDIPEVNNIIHYHLPLTNDSFIHRVGRTARWQSTGNVYFLLSLGEEVPDYVGENFSEFVMQKDLPEPSLPIMATVYVGKGKKDNISKGDILGFLCKVGGLGKDDIGKIDVRERYTYVAVKRDKVNQVLSMTDGRKIKGIKTKIEIVK